MYDLGIWWLHSTQIKQTGRDDCSMSAVDAMVHKRI